MRIINFRLLALVMKIKELEEKIQKEIWRLQMLDYPSPTAHDYLHKMQKELKALKYNGV